MSRPQHNRELTPASNQGRVARDPAGLAAAERATRRLARSHYENFLVATVLLPKRIRQPMYNVYAFCRTADDAADESPSTDVALDRLNVLQRRLDATFAALRGDVGPAEMNTSEGDLFTALAHTIEQFDLPQQPFNDLLDAFRQDQTKTRYATAGQLLDYCRRSANPVGRIVLRLGACFDEHNAALADQICTGLQLANFWQDVARDYAIGRVYLPADEMDRDGVAESMLGQSSAPPELRRLLARQCDRAEGYFHRGLPLASRVPRWLSADVRLFAHGGLATLAAIRRVDFDVLRRRPTVSRWRQTGLLLRAMVGAL